MRSLSWKRSATFVAVLLLGALPSQAQWAGSSRAPRPVVAQPAAEFGVARVSDDDNAKPMSARMVKAAADPMGDMMPPPPGAMPMTTPPGAAPMMGGDAAPKCTACEAAQSGASCSACDGCNTCDSGCGCGCDYNWWCKLECPDACPQWKMFDDCCCLKEHCTTIEGYLDLGYTANGYGGNNNWNGPVGYNDRADEFQMNQAYIAIEKATKSEDCDWDLGGRMDLLYGTDARWIESTGLEKSTSGHEKWVSDERFYHLAMVQAYAELAKGDWKFKFGKFNGLLGYEVIDSRGNFFYSHSYSYLYAVPTTNTGFMATKTVNENVSYSLGVVSGWDDFFDNQGNVDFLGDISWTSCDKNTNLVFGLISGDERNAFGNETNRTAYSVVWTQKINDRLSNVVEHDLGVQQNGNAAQNANATWYTLSDYLTYQLSCDWWLAGRVEWFQDTNGTRVAAIGDTETTNAFPGSNPASAGGFAGNFYEYTVGLNYKPQSNQNLIVRPELRWDNYNGVGNPFDNGTRQTQFLFAIDALLKF